MTATETILSLVGAGIGVALARMVVGLILRVALIVVILIVLVNIVWQNDVVGALSSAAGTVVRVLG